MIDFETVDVNAAISEVLAALSSVVTVIYVYRGQKHADEKRRSDRTSRVQVTEPEGVDPDGREAEPPKVPEQRTVDNDGVAD